MQLGTVLLWLLSLLLHRSTRAVRETKYYDTLGISPDADDATIKSAYRREAKKWHPDRNKDKPEAAEKKFREVAEAYEVLSDAELRGKYDRFGSAGVHENGGGGGRGFGRDPFDMFQTFFPDGNVRFTFRTSGGSMGGGFRQRQQQQQRATRDLYSKNDKVVTQLEEMKEPGATMWVWAVNYYAPWCGHCQQMKSEWEQLAQLADGIIKVAAVNCESNENECEMRGVRGYPTIMLFPPNGGRPSEYEGDRTATAIKTAAYRLIPNHVLQISNPSALDKLLSSCRGTAASWHVCMVLFTDKALSPLYRSLAVQFSGRVSFGEVVGAATAVRDTFGVAQSDKVLVAVCNGDVSTVEMYRGSMKAAGVREFVWNFTGGRRCAQSIRITADTDFGKLRVGQLKELLNAKGETCGGCLEKQDYIDKLRSLIGATS